IDEGFDTDNDGYSTCEGDCNDNNAAVNPGATEICNNIDDDCDASIDEGFDTDNDGYSTCEGDCNDNNAAVNPGATEICNNIDDDCDAGIDEGFDTDNDGYTTCEGDCNDNNNAIKPGGIEICNNIDDDCDGSIDEGFDLDNDGYTICEGDCDDNNQSIHPGMNEICNNLDDDCDGSIDEGFDLDNDGYTTCQGDCNDQEASINPGGIEICNGLDDDCDGASDEGLLITYYFDADNDGYGNDQLTIEACSLPQGYVYFGGDCSDNEASINPGVEEICGNGIDDNCDNIYAGDAVELICPSISLLNCTELNSFPEVQMIGGCPDDELVIETFVDIDVNGCAYNIRILGTAYRGSTLLNSCETMVPVFDMDAPVFSAISNINATLLPGETSTIVNFTPDVSDNCHDVSLSCAPPSGSLFAEGTTTVNCTATDACGNSTLISFDVIVSSNAIWYQDNDSDGYGNPDVSVASSTPPAGYVSDSTDCNDNAVAINPGTVEICNGIDDNCDEQIDEGYDTDGDGFTDCEGDCDDNNNTIYPGAAEICNNIDDDCDGSIDEGFDTDGDGFTNCEGDCDDNNNTIYPGAAEICNNIDDDCDGLTDEGVGTTWYADIDGDGYGDNNSSLIACSPPLGYIGQAGDCNDNNSAINPTATEICFNGIDEDCDGTADDGCPLVANDWKQYAINLNVGAYNACSNTAGNMALATASPESQSTTITGQDLWYSFTALSPGIQIKVSTSSFNALVELQNSAGVMIESENFQSTNGSEHLNIGSLTLGQQYFISVRNYNSAQGTGNFNICLTDLPASGCLTPAASYTMCSKFKAVVVNATNYVYNFTSTQTNITYSRTQPSATLDLYKVMNMPTGSNYAARVDASYTVTRGNGSLETVVVIGPSSCTFAFNADPLLILATTQDCPSPRPLGVNIRSNTTVCYSLNYQWEFQKADLSEPVFSFNGGSTQYLMITSAMGFVPGTTYNVRIRVTYQSGYTNPWGPWKCLLIAGGAGMAEYFDDETGEYTFDRNDEEIDIKLYPNPNTGNSINLEIAGIESGVLDVQLLDGMGKLIATRQITVEGYAITNWEFESELSAGLYFIQFTYENKRYAEKIIVE
ncbi:MAG: MopE-related protein, partial [Flavobacteriales bacterium]